MATHDPCEADLTRSPIQRTGFVYPEGLVRDERRRSTVLTRLIALTVLIASIAVVASTLSFGMASACPETTASSPR
jgi:hypothetical protein